MNLDELERRLFAVARAEPVSEQVPFAFEKRIIARIKESPRLDAWSFWARALWRAAASCVAIMLLLSAWSFFAPHGPASSTTDLSQEFENTVLAAVEPEPPVD
jgi:hypothetical protein